MTQNTGWIQVAPNQNQKEVTINDSLHTLDSALTNSFAIDFSSGAVTLTGSQFAPHLKFDSANQSANLNLNIPLSQKLFIVNNTSLIFTITVAVGPVQATVLPREQAIFYADGAGGLIKIVQKSRIELSAFIPGAPAVNTVIAGRILPGSGFYPQNFVNSFAYSTTAPSAQTVFDVELQGIGIGSLTFPAGVSTASFTTSNLQIDFTSGSTIDIIAPATVNGLTGFRLALIGYAN